jgi:parallel beta helix pectate lyase-like protein
MKNKITLLVLAILFSLLIPKPVSALQPQMDAGNFPPGTTIFVDASNTSGVEDGTLSHPFNTIQEGINIAATGTIVGVGPGVYFERINVNAGVQLVGTNSATTIIDGSRLGTVVTMNNASVLKGFTVQNGRASFGAGIVSIGQPVITHNIIKNNAQTAGGSGAAIDGNGSSPIITYNLIMGNTADTQWTSGAISFVNSSSPYIASNVIMNNTGRGAINITVPTGNRPTIINNTILNNTGAGIKIDDRVNQTAIHVANNILKGNTTGILIDFGTPANLPVFAYNDVYGNTANFVGMTDISGVNGNISVDPLFSDAFHLSYFSPMLDSGSPTEYSPEDFDGSLRPLDGNGDGQAVSDIGADERVYGDDIPPAITVTATKEDGTPYVAGTWTNQNVTVKFSCSDNESDIASCPSDAVLSTDGSTSITGVAVDRAGNSASIDFGPIKIDKTAPVLFISVSPNPVLLNGTAELEKNATDELSGINPGSLPCLNLDTSTVGTKSVTCYAQDNAGNQTVTTVQYQVIYDFVGFLSPVIDCVNNPCTPYNLSFFNVGSPISLKLQLKDANGNLVQSTSAPLWLTPLKIEGNPPVYFPDGYPFQTTGATYTWKKSLYQYDWSTKKYPARTTWMVGVKLDDGKTYYVFVYLK